MSAPLEAVAAAVGGTLLKRPDHPVDLADATHDSRQVEAGWLFCCVVGTNVDGHDFAAKAAQAGASALLVDRELDLDLPQILVAEVRPAMALAAAEIHGRPSSSLTVIGVTGTNGKSSIVQLLKDVFASAGRRAEIIGTLQGPRTTPESTDLQRLLRSHLDAGVEVVAIEVSSHALVLDRVLGVEFACAIFTNLGRDHLDFHPTMADYFEAKALLFTPLYSRRAVVNADDPHGRRLADRAAVPTEEYSLSDVSNVVYEGPMTRFRWRGHDVELGLAGAHNVSNAVAAATAATLLGLTDEEAVVGLEATVPVRGRFEMVEGGQPFLVAVDYAHTPDALDAALIAARQAADRNRIILVFGCGGDRDVDKRPEMAQVAEKGADVVIVTSDNPRSEDPNRILEDIGAGFSGPDVAEVVVDRRSAIERALSVAETGDVVLIAGKGHETYQIIGDRTVDFDDRAVALDFLGRGA